MNSNRITESHNASEITFLDVSTQKQTNGSLSTELFRKPMAENSLLHASSFHPKLLLASIPYSQHLRARRNGSGDIRFKKGADILRDRLLERGIPRPLSRKPIKRY